MTTEETIDHVRPEHPHEWQRGRFTGAMTCAKCKLLPLDDDEFWSECPGDE